LSRPRLQARITQSRSGADTDRHGNRRLFVRRLGRNIRIRAQPGTKGFADAYSAALEALESGAPQLLAPRGGAPAGTLGWLAATYFAAIEFTSLPTVSQSTRRGIIEACLRESIKPNSPDKLALCPLPLLSAVHIRMLRDRRADKPGAANNRLKYVGSMLSWAVERNLIRANPARDVKPLRYATDGFHALKHTTRSVARHGSHSRSCCTSACAAVMS
jgi:hypothetical protein